MPQVPQLPVAVERSTSQPLSARFLSQSSNGAAQAGVDSPPKHTLARQRPPAPLGRVVLAPAPDGGGAGGVPPAAEPPGPGAGPAAAPEFLLVVRDADAAPAAAGLEARGAGLLARRAPGARSAARGPAGG